MAKQIINIGQTANDKSGDPLRTAFDKVNQNFTELYSLTGGDIAALTELAQDYAASMFVNGTHSNITVTYDDANNKLNLTVPAIPADVNDLTDLTGLLGVANRLNNGINNVEMTLNESGTLNVDTLFPVVFTATVDASHYAGAGSLTLTDTAWYFQVAFLVDQNGTISVNITNNTPWASNPGYVNDMPFAFTEADHGIPGYTFTLTLVDIQNPSQFMYTTNLTASQAPALPSTFASNDAVKLTAGLNSWTFGTNGNITLPLGGDILNSAGTSVLNGNPFDQDLNTTDSPQFSKVRLTLGEITGYPYSEMNHRIVLTPNSTLLENFLLYVDQSAGSFLRAGMEMPPAQIDKASSLAFPHANGNVGYLYSQGADTNGTEFNDAFNIMSNGADLKLSAFNSETRHVWTFGTDGVLGLGSSTGSIHADQTTGMVTIADYLGPGGIPSMPSSAIHIGGDNAFSISRGQGLGLNPYWRFGSDGILYLSPTGDGTGGSILRGPLNNSVGIAAYNDTGAGTTYTLSVASTGQINLPTASDGKARLQNADGIEILSNTAMWTFSNDGGITFPGGSQIITSEGGSDALILKGPALGYVDLRGSILIGYQQSSNVSIGNPSGGTLLELLAEQVKFLGQAVPATSKGAAGDVPGLVAMDDFYIYHCIGTYLDGLTDIWKRVAWSGDTW